MTVFAVNTEKTAFQVKFCHRIMSQNRREREFMPMTSERPDGHFPRFLWAERLFLLLGQVVLE